MARHSDMVTVVRRYHVLGISVTAVMKMKATGKKTTLAFHSVKRHQPAATLKPKTVVGLGRLTDDGICVIWSPHLDV